MAYLVALGAPVPFSRLQRIAEDVETDWEAVPPPHPGVRDSFPDEDAIAVIVRVAAADTSDELQFVSHRHTVTRALRRLVERAATQLGCVHVLVHDSRKTPIAVRRQQTSLRGFLRLGRVVQDDVLLTVQAGSTSSS